MKKEEYTVEFNGEKHTGTHTEMTWSKWTEKFKPETDEHGDMKRYWNEPELADLHKEHRVWSQVDADGVIMVVSGMAFVNCLDFLVTEKPYEPKDNYVVIDQEDVEAEEFYQKVYDALFDKYAIEIDQLKNHDELWLGIENDKHDGHDPVEYADKLAKEKGLI